MRRAHAVVLALVLVCAFATGLLVAPQASASGPSCFNVICHGEQIVCCEGQICCPQCVGNPPICW